MTADCFDFFAARVAHRLPSTRLKSPPPGCCDGARNVRCICLFSGEQLSYSVGSSIYFSTKNREASFGNLEDEAIKKTEAKLKSAHGECRRLIRLQIADARFLLHQYWVALDLEPRR